MLVRSLVNSCFLYICITLSVEGTGLGCVEAAHPSSQQHDIRKPIREVVSRHGGAYNNFIEIVVFDPNRSIFRPHVCGTTGHKLDNAGFEGRFLTSLHKVNTSSWRVHHNGP